MMQYSIRVIHFWPNKLRFLGQERFGNMTRVYYKEAVGCFVVFDVSRSSTFEAVLKWKNDVDSKLQLPDGSPVPCVLLANKV
jgi:Ras-related protein Rab-32